jgi:hypothetical protein
MGWDWDVVLNVLAATAALATVVASVFQSRRPERAFSRYERWARIRDDASNVWEQHHAEQKRRESLVAFLATSETRARRRSIMVRALLWIVVLIGIMWVVRVAWPDGLPHFLWWLAAGGLIATVAYWALSTFTVLQKALQDTTVLLGFDVSPNGTEGAITPPELATQLRMVDGGRAIREFLRRMYPHHPKGAPWKLTREEAEMVKKRFGPTV